MNLSQICQKSIELIKSVGQFILVENQNFDLNKIEHKGFNDLVSYVDKEAEKKLVEGLNEIFPASFLTEENPEQQELSNAKFHWVIDPLDGTTNFLHSLPVYSVSVALLEGKTPIVGIVYEPNRDECFYAWQNSGAFCNEDKIQVSPNIQLSDSLLATGFPYYEFGKMQNYLKIVSAFMQKTHGLRRMGSAAIDLVYTALGRFDGFFEYNLNPWDVAAGALIVEEAGGKTTDFAGTNNSIFGREMIASNPQLHQEMLEVIQKYW